MPKKNGRLNRREENAFWRGMGAVHEWLDLHDDDEELPERYWDVYSLVRQLEDCAYTMMDWQD